MPEATKQAGEIRARWAWVEPTVWTERMLTALEEGVKGGKWFSLIDKVYALAQPASGLREGEAQTAGAAGVDHQTMEMFEHHLDANLEKLVATAAGRQLPSAGGAASVDTEAGEQREAPAGNPDGARPGGANGAAARAGADLRARLC